jgi:DNA mismatch repair protein MutL
MQPHERVVFERLRAEQRAGGVARDPLLVPETIELSATDVAALAEHGDVLARRARRRAPFGERTFLPHRPAARPRPRRRRARPALAAELAEDGASAAAERAADARSRPSRATASCGSASA